jgi:hypothetical protein
MSLTGNKKSGEPPAPDEQMKRTVTWEEMLEESPKEPENNMFGHNKEEQLRFMANPTTPYKTLIELERKSAENEEKDIEHSVAQKALDSGDGAESSARSAGLISIDKKSVTLCFCST